MMIDFAVDYTPMDIEITAPAQLTMAALTRDDSPAWLDPQPWSAIERTGEPWLSSSMKRDDVIAILHRHQAELKELGVDHLFLFGSMARGEAGEGSDIDLFFDHEKGALGLFELMDVKDRATSILGHRTDIMTRSSLHPRLRKRIEASAVLVF